MNAILQSLILFELYWTSKVCLEDIRHAVFYSVLT
jgi:hypothetical protein